MSNGKYVTRNKTPVIFILALLATIDPFSIDFYLPAFSTIAKDIHTTTNKISLSMTSYFIGLAIGQIIYGPLVDRYGRKHPLYIGLALYIIASFACSQAESLQALVIFRFLQALVGSVAAVSALAMVRDFFPVAESARIFSTLMLIIGISPLAAPSLGGIITTILGWQWVFIALIIIVLIVIILVVFCLPKAAPPDKTVSLKPSPILKTFFQIFTNTQFITYTLTGTFAFSTLFIYVAGAPVIFLDIYKISPRNFGLIFSLLSCGFIASNQLNIILLKNYTSQQIFKVALLCHLVITAVFLIGAICGWFGMWGIVVMFLLTLGCLGSINPNASALALAPFENNLGSASALMGFLQIGIAGTLSAFIGLVSIKNITPIPVLMLSTSLIAVTIFYIGGRKLRNLKMPDASTALVS